MIRTVICFSFLIVSKESFKSDRKFDKDQCLVWVEMELRAC